MFVICLVQVPLPALSTADMQRICRAWPWKSLISTVHFCLLNLCVASTSVCTHWAIMHPNFYFTNNYLIYHHESCSVQHSYKVLYTPLSFFLLFKAHMHSEGYRNHLQIRNTKTEKLQSRWNEMTNSDTTFTHSDMDFVSTVFELPPI